MIKCRLKLGILSFEKNDDLIFKKKNEFCQFILIFVEIYIGYICFASTAQPGTQSDNIWARWPAKPPCHLFSFNILTKVDHN